MENRAFKLHPDILWSIIQAQAGTLEKALLELVMNSIDAGASKVDLLLTETNFSVVDNGRGFTSRTEIESFFETFGTPHKKGDATYGRFRMGRGQIMAFSKNYWKSGCFQMKVDIKNKGLNYILKQSENIIDGCSINGDLYDHLMPSELLNTVRTMKTLCMYTPVPIFLNGKQISLDMSAEKWTLVDDDAYYQLNPNRSTLEVFNLGVRVAAYSASTYGCGGTIVSRSQLEVNFARNDILISKCDVWKRIAAVVRLHAKQSEKKPVKNESYRFLLATQLMAGEIESVAELTRIYQDEKLFTDVCGKKYSINQLRNALSGHAQTLTQAPMETNLKADKLQQSKMAMIISQKTLEVFGVKNLNDLFDALLEGSDSVCKGERYNNFSYTLKQLLGSIKSFTVVSACLNECHHAVDVKKVTRSEKAVLNALKSGTVAFGTNFLNAGIDFFERELRVGESETADAWTDGESYIFINRKQLKIGGYAGNALTRFVALGHLLAHEYLHNTNDSSGHSHDADFWEAYHTLTCTEMIGEFTHYALSNWLSSVKADEKLINRGAILELDRQSTVEKIEVQKTG